MRAHIGNIMRKYRLHNRTQIAIIFALQSAPRSLRRDLGLDQGCQEAIPPAAKPGRRRWHKIHRVLTAPE